MKKISALFTLLVLAVMVASCQSSYKNLEDGLYADIQTNKGNIVAELYFDQTPITVANFVSLAEGDNDFVKDEFKKKMFFNGLIFHRVIKDFMIQGGDPEGNGRGNPGYKFKDEIVDSLKLDDKGILAMANSGPNTNGSQFFITQKATPWLNGKHTVFGKVVEGIAIVDSIAAVETSKDPMTRDKPVKDITIEKVTIVAKGKEAKKFKASKVFGDYMETAKKEAEEKEQKLVNAKKSFTENLASQEAKATAYDSGLKILWLKEGAGEKPELGSKVNVYYAGYLTDGSLFDSNIADIATTYGVFSAGRRDRGGYNAFPMDYSQTASLIPGFKEGLLQMKKGDKVRLFIPSYLGYGDREMGGGVIPANSDLVFDIEIVE